MGLSENVVYPMTQWFCWSLSLLFMAISLGVYPIFRHIQMIEMWLGNLERLPRSLKAGLYGDLPGWWEAWSNSYGPLWKAGAKDSQDPQDPQAPFPQNHWLDGLVCLVRTMSGHLASIIWLFKSPSRQIYLLQRVYLVSTNELCVLTMFHIEIQRSVCEHVCSKAENFRALCTGEKGEGKASAAGSWKFWWTHRTGCFVWIFDHPYFWGWLWPIPWMASEFGLFGAQNGEKLCGRAKKKTLRETPKRSYLPCQTDNLLTFLRPESPCTIRRQCTVRWMCVVLRFESFPVKGDPRCSRGL